MDRSALLVGATGLVGGEVLDLLLADAAYARVVVWGRRATGRRQPKLEEQVVDFERLEATAGAGAVDDVFCCLGTTIRQAGSQEAFRRVDHDYPQAVARLARSRGATQYLLVSALGADSGSRVFYNRVKGEVEDGVRQVGFESVSLLRPSLLLGERAELRAGEKLGELVMRPLSPLMLGPLRRYRPIPARAVAQAMLRLAAQRRPGVRVAPSDELARLAGGG